MLFTAPSMAVEASRVSGHADTPPVVDEEKPEASTFSHLLDHLLSVLQPDDEMTAGESTQDVWDIPTETLPAEDAEEASPPAETAPVILAPLVLPTAPTQTVLLTAAAPTLSMDASAAAVSRVTQPGQRVLSAVDVSAVSTSRVTQPGQQVAAVMDVTTSAASAAVNAQAARTQSVRAVVAPEMNLTDATEVPLSVAEAAEGMRTAGETEGQMPASDVAEPTGSPLTLQGGWSPFVAAEGAEVSGESGGTSSIRPSVQPLAVEQQGVPPSLRTGIPFILHPQPSMDSSPVGTAEPAAADGEDGAKDIPKPAAASQHSVPFHTVSIGTQRTEHLTTVSEGREVNAPSVVEQIVREARVRFRRGETEMSLRLQPPHLGRLEMRLVWSGSELTAQLSTETPAARRLVEASLPALYQALTEQGIRVDRVAVSVGQNFTAAFADANPFGDDARSSESTSQWVNGSTGQPSNLQTFKPSNDPSAHPSFLIPHPSFPMGWWVVDYWA